MSQLVLVRCVLCTLYNSNNDYQIHASPDQLRIHIHYGHVYSEKLRAARLFNLIGEQDYPKAVWLADKLTTLSIMRI